MTRIQALSRFPSASPEARLRRKARAGHIASQLTRGKKLISRQVAAAISGLSERQVGRLGKEGRFPRPIRLGVGKNGRVAYVEAEVLDWVEARIAERDRQIAAGKPEPESAFTAQQRQPRRSDTQSLES